MKQVLKAACITCALSFLLLAGCLALDQIPYARAKPPAGVTDVATCLIWLKQPNGAYRITTGESVYYMITGPAGRYLPSGSAAYAFDSNGKFMGWTPDEGDIHTPEGFLQPTQKMRKFLWTS